MRKVLCFLLAVIMLVGLCGCVTDNRNKDVDDETTGENTTQNEKEPEFSFGKTENNTYQNDFLGITCTLPDEWVFYTEEQILEINNIVGDYLDEDAAELIENANIIYDMYAANESTGSNMNVNLEKLSALQLIDLDIKQALESQFDTIKSAYQNMGYSDVAVKYQKVAVDGRDFDGIKITAKIQDVDFYVTGFSFRKGNYLASITICSVVTDNTTAILDYFTVE